MSGTDQGSKPANEMADREVPALLGASERNARRVVSALIARGVLISASTRAPLRLAMPATLAGSWMPGLFPEQPAEGDDTKRQR